MNSINPYASPQTSRQLSPERYGRFVTSLLGIGFLLVFFASYLFLFAESFTLYKPYSVERQDWNAFFASGSDYSINSHLSFFSMIGSGVLGSLLVVISSVLKIRSFCNRR